MSAASDRIEYIVSGIGRSDAWISRETGIPRSTLGYVRRGERDLPAGYTRVLQNVYQREAYARLRDTGFSVSQAQRFKWYAPARVSDVQEKIAEKIAYLATGRAKAIMGAYDLAGEEYSSEEIYEESWLAIWEGFRESEASEEDWEQYGAESSPYR